MINKILATVFFSFLLMGTSFAQDSMNQKGMPMREDQRAQGMGEGQSEQGGSQMSGKHKGFHGAPPQVAIDACTGKSEDAACEFEGPYGSKKGVCVTTPDKQYFACRPNDMKMYPPEKEGQRSQGQVI